MSESLRDHHENASIRRAQGRHRAWSALMSLSFAATLGGASIGCSGEGVSGEGGSGEGAAEAAPSNDAAENALIESHLEGRGYDTSTLQFQGDTVIVEHDIAMPRAELLHDAEAEAAGIVEKGYFNGTRLFVGQRIQLSFAAGVSNTWQTALNAARDEWNRKTPRFIRDPGAAATISVVLESQPRDTIALGSPPSRTGGTITLNPDFSGSCGTLDTMPANAKLYAALHEMGHVLGFAHPPPAPANGLGRAHIAGTAQSNGTANLGYATIMKAGSGCSTATTLTPDDVLSAQKKYPSCMTACEQACFAIGFDPSQIAPCVDACTGQCGG